jgi:hypothetical protein
MRRSCTGAQVLISIIIIINITIIITITIITTITITITIRGGRPRGGLLPLRAQRSTRAPSHGNITVTPL